MVSTHVNHVRGIQNGTLSRVFFAVQTAHSLYIWYLLQYSECLLVYQNCQKSVPENSRHRNGESKQWARWARNEWQKEEKLVLTAPATQSPFPLRVNHDDEHDNQEQVNKLTRKIICQEKWFGKRATSNLGAVVASSAHLMLI